MRPVLTLLLAALCCGGEPLPAGTVARVGGTDLTTADLTRELLKREGADALLQWVQGHLEGIAWNDLGDDAVVMAVAGHELRKRDLAALLLKQDGAKVREQLVDIMVVEQAVAKAGIVFDDATLAAEFRLMERDFQRRMAKSGQGHIDFASYLKVKERLTVEQFLAQPAVRMLAGLHELARRQVARDYDDAKLQTKLDAERILWDQRASLDLSVIHLPWKRDDNGAVSDAERIRLQSVANLIHRQIAAREVTFEKAWDAFGKSWDASGPGGRIGWVDLEGRREDETARRIPRNLVERAFASDGQLPILMPPAVHDAGVDLALVHAKRPARAVTLAEVRDRLLLDILEKELEGRTKTLVAELRRNAVIEYGSLPGAGK